jgi:hypothetical protein
MDNINSLNFTQCAALIKAIGAHKTVLIEGESGIGKSALLGFVSKDFPDYEIAYIDAANIDLGDLNLPVPDIEAKCVRWFTNEVFKLHTGRPVVFMIDEFAKAARPIQNSLLPLILERRIGSTRLPEGSIGFATTNKANEGLGDNMQAHVRNRVVFVEMRKPTADEWIENYAVPKGLASEVIVFVKEHPQVFDAYIPGAKQENPYINSPTKPNRAFVTHRSMETASVILKSPIRQDAHTLRAALAGAIGERAAGDLAAFIDLADKLPKYEDVVKAPLKTPVPKTGASSIMLTYNLIARVNVQDFDAVIDYVLRLQPELQALFFMTITRDVSKRSLIAAQNKKYLKYAEENNEALKGILS